VVGSPEVDPLEADVPRTAGKRLVNRRGEGVDFDSVAAALPEDGAVRHGRLINAQ
jgi:hypothetical protein